jgi:hypothetical protein
VVKEPDMEAFMLAGSAETLVSLLWIHVSTVIDNGKDY